VKLKAPPQTPAEINDWSFNSTSPIRFKMSTGTTLPLPRCYRGQLKCDDTRAETRFRLLGETDESILIDRGASVQSTTGSQVVRISGSKAGYTMFRGGVKSTGYPLHSPVSPLLPLPCVTVRHHISTELYYVTATDVSSFLAFPNNMEQAGQPLKSFVPTHKWRGV
jgi:hypothetical protein